MANTTYTVSGFALSPFSKLTRIWIREYNSSGSLIFNSGPGQINPSTWTRQSYTFTTTSTTASVIIDLYFYNVASGEYVYWDSIQLEQKPYATSFVEGSRAYGSLKFTNDLQAEKTYSFWFKYEGVPGTPTWIFHSNNSSIQRLGLVIGTSYAIDVAANGYYNTGYNLNNINGQNLVGQWVYCVITVSSSTMNFYLNGLLIKSQSYTGALPTNPICLGSAQASTLTSVSYDEFSSFNRALAENEIKRIYYSNQPLQESPGMTYINGGKVRTGWISSENYVPGVSGSMWNLNTGLLETNDCILRGTIYANAGLIGGWTIAQEYIDNQYQNDTVNGYLARLTTDLNNSGNNRPGLQFNWGDPIAGAGYESNTLRNSITIGAATYIRNSVGDFSAIGWDYSGGGISINIDANTVLFAGKRGTAKGAFIAGWSFDYRTFTKGDVRIEASSALAGIAVKKAGTYLDLVKVGKYNLTLGPDDDWGGAVADQTASVFSSVEEAGFDNGVMDGWTKTGSNYSGGSAQDWSTLMKVDLYASGTSGDYVFMFIPPTAPEQKYLTLRRNITSSAILNNLRNKTAILDFDYIIPAGYSGKNAILRLIISGSAGNYLYKQFPLITGSSSIQTFHVSEYIVFDSIPADTLNIQLSVSGYTNFTYVNYTNTHCAVYLDSFSLKTYDDTFVYVNEKGLSIYKSPKEYAFFRADMFNVNIPKFKVNGFPVIVYAGAQ
ncbi:MAG TPA: LamG-like jellyroll fold domain-containing protein, partial [Ignavibacteriales bacterium]|nr:LamG-like jellyroll fold domain-containing protein [Ignavibacteriales bacterium]